MVRPGWHGEAAAAQQQQHPPLLSHTHLLNLQLVVALHHAAADGCCITLFCSNFTQVQCTPGRCCSGMRPHAFNRNNREPLAPNHTCRVCLQQVCVQVVAVLAAAYCFWVGGCGEYMLLLLLMLMLCQRLLLALRGWHSAGARRQQLLQLEALHCCCCRTRLTVCVSCLLWRGWHHAQHMQANQQHFQIRIKFRVRHTE